MNDNGPNENMATGNRPTGSAPGGGRPYGFEDRLKAALLARLPEEPAPTPARSFVRRYGVPLAVGLATAAVLGLVALPGGGGGGGSRPAGTSSATEPVVRGDGTILVAWPSYEGVPETVDKLRALGVRVAMVQRRPPGECSDPGGGHLGPEYDPASGKWKEQDPDALPFVMDGDQRMLRITAKTVPEGHTLVLARAAKPAPRVDGVSVGVVATEKVPSCEIDFSAGQPSSPGAPPARP
ncbi:hypothetical protein EDE04_5731 [Streptomyces sp. 2132.2]|uniref:hypothetical protein n=1 Tax=Streptomyces TaxID=1883 RepID=UPI000F4A2748|nr:hypothetical protein [Streptomyces sp. 2132.2]ROQ99181.1 hypothetical protein EDE04_5731 [Streptomyces sp. 2132.2]